MERMILHCDCNGFYASVEEQIHPEYKEIPMAVCGDPKNRRGIILAKNEKAKKYNIQTAETVWQALRKCPELTLAPPRHKLYTEYSQQINKIYREYSDLVEPTSIDESFIDITGTLHLFAETSEQMAHLIRKRVQAETGITISIGVSYNKIFAKLGSDYKKPNAVTVITKDNFTEILWPLPVARMFMVGAATAEILTRLHIFTIEDLAKSDAAILTTKLGKVGDMLHRYANGLDDDTVLSIDSHYEASTIGNGMTFRRNLVSRQDIKTGISALVDSVASRLRGSHLKCTTVQISIKNPQLKTISRQRTFDTPTWLAKDLYEISMEIIENEWKIGQPIRMLTVTAANLISPDSATEQLSFFSETNNTKERTQRENLEKTMDTIRGRYGRDSLKLGSVIDNDLGIHSKEEE